MGVGITIPTESAPVAAPVEVVKPAPVVAATPVTSIAKKKKLNKADFMFRDKKDEVLVKKPGDINGIDFMIKDLENCTIVLLDHTA